MSKYIDLEDAIGIIQKEIDKVVIESDYDNTFRVGLRLAKNMLSDLPTIEVSEEVLKATKNFNAYTIADENAEMGMRTQIEPIIEVSKDEIQTKQSELTEAYIRGYKDGAEAVTTDCAWKKDK